jgi:hypothetical protein
MDVEKFDTILTVRLALSFVSGAPRGQV